MPYHTRYINTGHITKCSHRTASLSLTVTLLLRRIVLFFFLLFLILVLCSVRSVSADPSSWYVPINLGESRPLVPVSTLISLWRSHTTTRGAASSTGRWDIAIYIENARRATTRTGAGAGTTTRGSTRTLTIPRSFWSFFGSLSTAISRPFSFPVSAVTITISRSFPGPVPSSSISGSFTLTFTLAVSFPGTRARSFSVTT